MLKLRKNEGEKGITLIALVITIIVLLILAGVSIAMLTGDNGILNQAQKAKNETEAAAENEAGILSDYEDKLNEYNNSNYDSKSLKIVVNSGDYKTVSIGDYGSNFTVDWGDGTVENSGYEVGSSRKLASIDSVKVAEIIELTHTYPEANKEYTISISGNYTLLTLTSFTKEQVIEIAQWGETELEKIDLKGCTNLTKIASPTKNSFKNIADFSAAFMNTGLTSIPEDLFANCQNATDFTRTFEGSKIISIPEDLFANCQNATDFTGTFAETKITNIPENLFKNCNKASSFVATFGGCNELTNYLPLWESEYFNGGNLNVGPDKAGEACYGDCEKLLQNEDNLDAIPEFWRSAYYV